jgi:signal transduction histidine kinase
VQLTSEGQRCSLTPHTRRQVLFICQEAINNIERHAHAHHVKIHLDWQVTGLAISISDDGRGFDGAAALGNDQSGLSLMGERAEDIKGEISVDSSGQTGTKVILRVPLQMVDWLPDLKSISLSASAWNTDAPGLGSR